MEVIAKKLYLKEITFGFRTAPRSITLINYFFIFTTTDTKVRNPVGRYNVAALVVTAISTNYCKPASPAFNTPHPTAAQPPTPYITSNTKIMLICTYL